MRISVRPSDPGYSAKAFGATVYLDGKKIKKCFTADDELGVVYCCELDEKGQVQIDPENENNLKETEMRGNVEIVLPRDLFEA